MRKTIYILVSLIGFAAAARVQKPGVATFNTDVATSVLRMTIFKYSGNSNELREINLAMGATGGLQITCVDSSPTYMSLWSFPAIHPESGFINLAVRSKVAMVETNNADCLSQKNRLMTATAARPIRINILSDSRFELVDEVVNPPR